MYLRWVALWALLLGVLLPCVSHARASLSPELICGREPCHVWMQGGPFALHLQDVEMKCKSATGQGLFESRTTGRMRIESHGCREHATPFEMSCIDHDKGSSGAIETNTMGSSMVDEAGSPNILLNSTEINFICGGGEPVHVEGFFIGAVGPDACKGAARLRYGLHMKLIAHGHEGVSSQAPNYDVYIDGRSGEEWDFEKDWAVDFGRPVQIVC
jgi:hypothetical protein